MRVRQHNSTLYADTEKRLRPVRKGKVATKAERSHLEAVKSLQCGFCGAPPPSEAHHIRRGTEYKEHYATVPLCPDCHGGLHANRSRFRQAEEMLLQATLTELHGDDAAKYMRLAGRVVT